MVEKLRAYLAELEAKKADLLAEDFTVAIETAVAEFKQNFEAKLKADQATAIAKLDSDMDCINGLIAREEKLSVEQPEANVILEDNDTI